MWILVLKSRYQTRCEMIAGSFVYLAQIVHRILLADTMHTYLVYSGPSPIAVVAFNHEMGEIAK